MAYLPSVYFTKMDTEELSYRYSKKETKVTVLFQVIQPILLLLRLTGRFPYALQQCSRNGLHCGWVAYSIAVGALQLGGVFLTSNMTNSLTDDSFDVKVFSIVSDIICAVLGLSPLLIVLEASWFNAYMDKWTAFEEELRSFDVLLDTRLQKWLLLAILALFPYVGVTSFFLEYFRGDAIALPVYFMLQLGSYLLLLLWFFMVFFIEDVATLLFVRLEESGSQREVAIIKKLWLTLANLTIELGQVLSLPLIRFMAVCSILGIANSYSLLFFFRDWFTGNIVISSNRKLLLFVQVSSLIICTMILASICENGHRCTVSVGSKFLKEILKINFSLRNENTQRELHSLFQTIMLRYPNMALSGYFTLNRRLFATMVSVGITYLIVLFQFRSSCL